MKLSQIIFKDSIAYGAVRYLSILSAIILTPIYTRLISMESYGAMEIFNTWNAVIIGCLPLGLLTALQKYYPENKNDKTSLKSMLGTILLSLIVLNLFYVLISLIIKDYFESLFFSEVTPLFNIVYWQSIGIIFLSIIDEYNTNILRSEFKRNNYLTVSILRFLILTLLGFYFVYYTGSDYEGFYRASLIAVSISVLLGLYYNTKYISLSFNTSLFKQIIKFSIHFVSVFVLFQVNNLIDRFLINHFIDIKAVGVYSIGFRIATMANIIYSSFTLAWYPYAMSLKNSEHLQTIFNIVHKIFIIISILIISIVWLYRAELIYIFAPDYHDSYYIILILLVSNIITSGAFIYSLGLHYTNKTKYLSYAAFFSVLINFVVSIITVNFWGINGIAIGTLLGSIVWVFYQYYHAQKNFYIDFDNRYYLFFFLFILFYFTLDLFFYSKQFVLLYFVFKSAITFLCIFIAFVLVKNKLKDSPILKL